MLIPGLEISAFARMLQTQRDRAGLAQEALAAKLDVEVLVLRKLEQGELHPWPALQDKLAVVLGDPAWASSEAHQGRISLATRSPSQVSSSSLIL